MSLLEYPYTRLGRVISGGQDGADLGGLEAAWDFNILTGGHCPKFYRTSSGPNLDLRDKFGLIETDATNYQKRTGLNAKNGDGTIRFASDFSTAGEQLTLRFIKQYDKPYFDVNLPVLEFEYAELYQRIGQWIVDNRITTLNVAGNRDKDRRQGFHFKQTYIILTGVFMWLKENT